MTTPNFETIYDAHESTMLKDAYEAITACDLWGWMKAYVPEEGQGFMFSNHPNLARIDKEMKYGGHSGSSYGWTMRQMESIAKIGWEEHRNRVREARANRELKEWAKQSETNRELKRWTQNQGVEQWIQDLPRVLLPTYNGACPCRRAQGHTSGWCGVAGGGVPGCEH